MTADYCHASLVLDQPKIDGLGRTRGRGDGETRRIFTRQSDCGGLLVKKIDCFSHSCDLTVEVF